MRVRLTRREHREIRRECENTDTECRSGPPIALTEALGQCTGLESIEIWGMQLDDTSILGKVMSMAAARAKHGNGIHDITLMFDRFESHNSDERGKDEAIMEEVLAVLEESLAPNVSKIVSLGFPGVSMPLP